MLRSRRDQINWLADHVRKACELTVPVDVGEAVKRLGGTIQEVEQAEYEAWIEKKGEGFKISLRGQEADTRRRFSIAHELGHLFLHMGYLIEPAKWAEVGNYIDSVYYRFGFSTEEYEAHEFAAAFLMPRDEFIDVARKHKAGSAYRLEPIAEYFQVSEEAASNRGRWLGLFKWD